MNNEALAFEQYMHMHPIAGFIIIDTLVMATVVAIVMLASELLRPS